LKDFENAKKEQRLKVIKNRTTHQQRICILSEKALNELDKIQDDINFIFIENKFIYLSATLKNPNKPMLPTSWVRSINKTLSIINKHYNCSLVLKSHSFRVGFVTRLLKLTDIQKAAEIVGHKSLDTTKRYTRYLSDSYKTKEILEKAFQNDVT
jgi:integrase